MDLRSGEFNSYRNTLNIQPVIPVSLTENLSLIARVILPVIRPIDIEVLVKDKQDSYNL